MRCCCKSCIYSRRACGGYDCYMKALCFRLLIQQTSTAAKNCPRRQIRETLRNTETRFTLAHGGFRGGRRGVIAGHALWKAKNDNKKDRMKQRSGAEKLIGNRRFAGRRWGLGSVERWERRDGPADLPAVCMFSPYRNQEQENAQAFPPRPLLSFASGINSPFSCARM